MKQNSFADDTKASIIFDHMAAPHLLFLTIALFIGNTVNALSVKTNAIRNKSVFGISFPGEGRAYYGKEGNVQSVSIQEYITATFHVLEINIVSQGPALLRIYHSRPLAAEELSNALTGAARSTALPGSGMIRSPLPPNVESMIDSRIRQTADSITTATVIKEYPLATHARTIEFRVSSSHELLDLFDELQKHWIREPTLYEDGQIVEESETETDQGSESTTSESAEMKPRSLGGVLFVVEK